MASSPVLALARDRDAGLRREQSLDPPARDGFVVDDQRSNHDSARRRAPQWDRHPDDRATCRERRQIVSRAQLAVERVEPLARVGQTDAAARLVPLVGR